MAAKSDNKSKALELAISQVDKQFGTGSIMRLGNGLERSKKIFGSKKKWYENTVLVQKMSIFFMEIFGKSSIIDR